MRKGWRNDPAWVALYAKRDEDRIQRELNRLRLEAELNRDFTDLKRFMKDLEQNIRPDTYVAPIY